MTPRPSPIDSIASPWDEKRLDSFYNGSNMDKPLPIARPMISRENTWPEAEGLQVVHPNGQPYAHSTLEYFDPRPKGSPSQAPEAYYRGGFNDISPVDSRSGSGKPPYYHEIYQQRPRGPLGHDYPGNYQLPPQQANSPRIWGLSRKTFWLLFAVFALLVIAGAIAGGVGGALIHEQAANSATSTSSPDSSPDVGSGSHGSGGGGSGGIGTPVSSEPSFASTTLTNPTPLASSTEPATIVRDCPSSNGTVHTIKLGSSSQEFRKNCNAVYSSVKSEGENFVVQTAGSLNDCIQLCAQFNINSNLSPAGVPQSCNSVCWRNTYDGDHRAGTCFGYAVAMLPGSTAALGNDTTCDSALWINQPNSGTNKMRQKRGSYFGW